MNALYRYPRSIHLPWSPGATDDDKHMLPADLEAFKKLPEFIVTEKMDGGNLTFYRDYFHGRSLDSGTHAWDTAAKALWARVRYLIPEGWRISGESLYARRSVAYENLPDVYMVFGAWDEDNNALPWAVVTELAQELNLSVVPTLYRGPSFQEAVTAWEKQRNVETSEGFVVRNPGSFHYDDFQKNLVKWVRADHVRTVADWRHRDDFEVNTFLKK